MMICPSLTGRLCKKLIIATGHGMLGLTMATGTGKPVCDMMQTDQRGGIQTDRLLQRLQQSFIVPSVRIS
jgi:glycine/D-amino acid oxidase-like deaminating enzyme